jgi:CMP-N-acetylneuraminic acid synthetase
MKIIAIVPIKSKSIRVPGKNFKLVKGKPLYKFMLEKIVKCNFDKVYVDTDSDEIKNFCKKNKIEIINRLKSLSKNTANGNDLLNFHQKIVDADIYFQVFITSPLIKISTINNCIKFMKKTKKYDSILTCKSNYTWYWFEKKPVNYNPKILPRSQDAKPVVVETTALYGIKKQSLKKRRCRIGYKPYFYEVSDIECVDLDNKKDFEYLKYITS